MYSIKSMIRRLLKYANKYKTILIIALIISVIFVFSTLYVPYIIGREIVVLFDDDFEMNELIIPFIKLGAMIIIAVISGVFMGKLLNKVSYKIIKDIRIETFNKILNLPIKYLDSHPHGEILTIITTDLDLVWDGIVHGFTHLFRGAIAIIITIIFMFISKWEIALIVSLLTPLSMLASYLIAKLSHKAYQENQKITGEMGGFISEMINEQKTVIAFDMMRNNNIKYQEMDKKLYKVGVKAQFVSSFSNPTTRLINSIIYLAVIVVGSILIVKQPTIMNLGLLTLFLYYAAQYARPFNETSSVTSELTSAFASLKRVFTLLDEKEMPKSNDELKISINDPDFKFQKLNFSYDATKKILKNIDFYVPKNNKVAIVGPTGCGKTTLINIIMRFYDYDTGKLLINDTNIKNIERTHLRENIGMVLQDSYLFKGSVKENIAYAKLDASEEEIIQAAKDANAHDFIMKLKNGYDTIIDESSLSSGEMQLISIARLFLKVPNVLILDEATSNIDTRLESKIQKAFETLMQNKTCFIIAHRLSTIRHADLILVMKNGKIIEKGTHESLMKRKTYYKELYFSNN